MARAPQEYDLQRAVCLWLDGYPDPRGVPTKPLPLVPGVVYWHTANSGEGRDAAQGMRLKQQGVKPGIHDLLFLWGGLFGLELKKPGQYSPPEKGLSGAQRVMHGRLLGAGMAGSAVADSLAGVRAILFTWGLTVNK